MKHTKSLKSVPTRFALEDFLQNNYKVTTTKAPRPIISWLDRRSALNFHEEWINNNGGHIKLADMSITELQKARRLCCMQSQVACIRVIDTHLTQRARSKDFVMKDVRDKPVFE